MLLLSILKDYLYPDSMIVMFMKVQYTFYKPKKGLEEIQATIYNEALRKYGKGVTVTAEQIKQRYDSEKPDPKGIRYAFKDDDTPLAYIQTRVTEGDDEKRTYIGYPWVINECPLEVQEKLFDEMLKYIKTRDTNSKIVMGLLRDSWIDAIEFTKSKGFMLVDENPQYSIDVSKVNNVEQTKYLSRKATEDDLNIMVDLIKSDPIANKFFPNDEAISGYFKNSVLPDGHTILIFCEDQLVSSGAPLKGFFQDGVILRFSSLRPKFEDAWNILIVEICKHMCKENWQEPFFISTRGSDEREEFIKNLGGIKDHTMLLFELTAP